MRKVKNILYLKKLNFIYKKKERFFNEIKVKISFFFKFLLGKLYFFENKFLF
jgi:hypothetical protein